MRLTAKMTFMDSFTNYVAQPVLFIVSITMTFVGVSINLGDAKTVLDFALTLVLKMIPIATVMLAYFTNKDKIDANFKKTVRFRFKSRKTKKRGQGDE